MAGRLGSCVALAALLGLPHPAGAATLYASPTGTSTAGCTSRADACTLATATAAAVAGDTVVLMDGIYHEPLSAQTSGTASAWITFQADQCATPIIEGPGVGPTDNNQASGVQSSTAEYVRFVGLVSRGWSSGFSNGWTGGVDSGVVSNGHWEIESCIAYSNGRTGFTFFSASDFHLKSSISAHNGSNSVASWSSGVTLFEATGTNLVEGNVSFENTDAQQHTDGSGFIVDEGSNGATFVDNLAFGNSGSCLRLTRSSGTRFINNTCYRNSQFGSMATGPGNPGELYFTNAGVTVQGVTFMNNVIVATGQAPAGSQAVINQPTAGFTNNVVTTGTPTFFTAPTGTNPSFVPAASRHAAHAQGRDREWRAHDRHRPGSRSASSSARRSWSAGRARQHLAVRRRHRLHQEHRRRRQVLQSGGAIGHARHRRLSRGHGDHGDAGQLRAAGR